MPTSPHPREPCVKEARRHCDERMQIQSNPPSAARYLAFCFSGGIGCRIRTGKSEMVLMENDMHGGIVDLGSDCSDVC